METASLLQSWYIPVFEWLNIINGMDLSNFKVIHTWILLSSENGGKADIWNLLLGLKPFVTSNRSSTWIVYYLESRYKLIKTDDCKKVIRREFIKIVLENESKSFLEVVYVVR